jgi:hypothetical protein
MTMPLGSLDEQRAFAEETILAALLGDPSLMLGLRAVVEASDFSRPMGRCVFHVIDQVQRKGGQLEAPDVEIPFRLGKEFEAAGGHVALSRLIVPVNPKAPLLDYAALVHTAAREDRVRALLARAADPISNGNLRQLLREAEEMLAHEDGPQLRSLDFCSVDDTEAVSHLVQDRIKRGTKVILASEPKVGKSVAAQDLAIAASSGGRWLGQPIQNGPYRTLYFDEENPPGLARRRVGRLARERGMAPELLRDLPLRYCTHNALNLEDDRRLALFENEVTQFRPDLVIFDSLIRFRAPGSDENNNSETAAFAARVLSPLTARGITVVILHHLSKSGPGDGRERSILSRVRGAGDLCAVVDDLFGLTRCGKGEFRLTHEFTRDGQESPPLLVRIEDVDLCDGLRLIASDAEDTSRNEILATVQEAGASGILREDLMAQCDAAGTRVATRMLGALHGRGLVRKRREGKVVRYWAAEAAPKDAE